jgi:hypothetical protein
MRRTTNPTMPMIATAEAARGNDRIVAGNEDIRMWGLRADEESI